MESTFLIKVNESGLKRILNLDIQMNVIEVESIGDVAKLALLLKAMKKYSIYFIAKILEEKIQNNGKDVNLSDIFSYDGQRYYSTAELIDILSELKERKTGKPLQVENITGRIDKALDKIIWNNKHKIKQSWQQKG